MYSGESSVSLSVAHIHLKSAAEFMLLLCCLAFSIIENNVMTVHRDTDGRLGGRPDQAATAAALLLIVISL